MVALSVLISNIGLLCLFLLMDGADARTGLVTIEEFPYLGSLRSRKKESELAGSGYLCGATLIRNRVLVTTAECAQGKNPMDILGVVGATYLQGLSTTSKVLEIESIRCHGLYKRGRPSYNIALAFTAEDTLPIKGKLGYVPIAMKRVRPHTRCVGVSWAANTDVLSNQPIALPNYSVASPECYKTIQAVGMFCTYKRYFRGSQADHEDSGIPIMCNGKLAGIFVLHSARRLHVFTSIYAFRKWINGAIYLHFHKDLPVSLISMASMDGAICFQWLVVLAISIYLVG